MKQVIVTPNAPAAIGPYSQMCIRDSRSTDPGKQGSRKADRTGTGTFQE